MKKCRLCNKIKPFADFFPYGYHRCKECNLIRRRKYRKKNIEKIKKQQREAYERNKASGRQKNRAAARTEKYKKKAAEYKLKNADKIREWCRINAHRYKNRYSKSRRDWYYKNKETILSKQKAMRPILREKERERVRTDIQFKLRKRLRIRLRDALKENYGSGSAVRDLGCSIPEFKKYIESLFIKGMSWENWCHSGWHIDHKKPLHTFDLTDRSQFLMAAHYTNLQPLWAKDNYSKNRITK